MAATRPRQQGGEDEVMQRQPPQPVEAASVTRNESVPTKHQPLLTVRDHVVLSDLSIYRYLTVAQVARLRFGHRKLAERRMRRLNALRVVERFQPCAAPRTGFHEWIYRLSPSGAQIVAADKAVPVDSVKPPVRRPRGGDYLAHHRELTDFRIWLHEGCRASAGAFALDFIPADQECRTDGRRHRRAGVEIPSVGRAIIPDAVFCLHRRDGRAALLMLEIDRGRNPCPAGIPTPFLESSTATARPSRLVAEASLATVFGHEFRGFRILFVVPDPHRANAVLRLAERAGSSSIPSSGSPPVTGRRSLATSARRSGRTVTAQALGPSPTHPARCPLPD